MDNHFLRYSHIGCISSLHLTYILYLRFRSFAKITSQLFSKLTNFLSDYPPII
nr:MAG TPA: hypothetical protein [Caudoviricetes sp.]